MPLGLMLLMLVLLLPLLALRHSSIIAVIPVDGCQKKKKRMPVVNLGNFHSEPSRTQLGRWVSPLAGVSSMLRW